MIFTKIFMQRVTVENVSVACQEMQKGIDEFLSTLQERENIKLLKIEQKQSPIGIAELDCLVTISYTYENNIKQLPVYRRGELR